MRKNLGGADRAVRLALAAAAACLLFAEVVDGTLALVVGVVGLAMLLTAATGFCSLYVPLGIDTRKRPKRER